MSVAIGHPPTVLGFQLLHRPTGRLPRSNRDLPHDRFAKAQWKAAHFHAFLSLNTRGSLLPQPCRSLWRGETSGSSSMSLAMRHPNERCTSCGMWKRRMIACEHCAKRPNRWQASPLLLTASSACLYSLLTSLLMTRPWQAAVAQLKRGAAGDLHSGRSFSMHGLAQNAREGSAGSTAPSGVQIGPGIGASTPHLPLSKPHQHPKVKCSR